MAGPGSVLSCVLSVIVVTGAREMERDSVTSVTTPIIPTFFDFKKEIEDIFPDKAQTKELLFDYDLQTGVTLERDYDFYSDNPDDYRSDLESDFNATGKSDVEMSGSAQQVTVTRGFFPQSSQSQATRRQDYDDYYDDDYDETPETRGYGHSSSGYSDHGSSYDGGHNKHGSYGGYKVQPKKPGPYGYPSPNFKCEKTSETLYVTETEMTYDKKCFNVYKTKCQDGYDEGKGIGYQKHCNEFTVTRCRTVFDTSSEERCWTVYKKQCDMTYETVVDYEYEQKCTHSYEEECHGYGYHQECEKVPKEHCKQVPKKVEKSVPRTKCKKVPDKRCQDFPINVPRKECKEFPKTVCTQDPVNVKKKIPKKHCIQIPKEVCNTIPRIIVKDVPKKVGKKVCHSTKVDSYGHSSSYVEPSSYDHQPSYGSSEYKSPAPATNYKAPAPSYSAPAPSPSYSAPDEYGAPKAAPTQGYGTETATNYGYKRLVAQRRFSGYYPSSQTTNADNWALGPG